MSTRLALIISSNYSENAVVASRDAFEDTGALVQERLACVETAFEVVALKANRDLPEQLDEVLARHRGKLEDLPIHFSGYLAVKPDRGPALLLDGARLRAFPISRLRVAMSQSALHALAIMDIVAVADGPANPEQIVKNLGIALHETTPHVAVLSSVALPEHIDPNQRGCTRLTDLWLLSLEYQAQHAHDSLVYFGPIVHGLQSERLAFARLPSFSYEPSDQDFLIMPGPQVGGFSGESLNLNSSTQRSIGVRPPGSETDPGLWLTRVTSVVTKTPTPTIPSPIRARLRK